MNEIKWTIVILLIVLVSMISYILYNAYRKEKIRKTWTPQVGDLVHFHMENPVIGEITDIGALHSTVKITVRNDFMYPV
jgi:hypothetical protein